jgi:thiamine-monophosphate kinase
MPVARDTGDIAQYASSMTDISDGLFIDLTRLCGESGTGAVIRLDRLPVSAGLEGASRLMGLDPMQLACSGGEDYEILFTAPDFPCEAYNTSHDIKVTCIGEVSDKGMTVIDREGIKVPLEAKGYEHFGPS